MKKSMTISALVLAATVTMPLQAYEGEKDDPVIMQQFTQLDANGDGLITKAEIEARPVLTRKMEVSVYGGFEMGDINSDGYLDWNEFLANEEVLPAE